MSNHIQITVSGVVASGKTTIAALIAKALLTHGFDNTDLNLLDGIEAAEALNDVDTLVKKRNALIEWGTTIAITEVQVKRSSPDDVCTGVCHKCARDCAILETD